jgi:predicted DNA-binding transcriptional regulator YafY
MTRTTRVMHLLDLLQASEAMSVAAIAGALGVSRRTVLRDLATLRERGWSIRAEPGPGGGVLLDRGRGVTAVHLAVDEVVALWLAGQMSASVAAMPWSAALRSGLNKVLASLPRERARSLHALMRRVVVGRPATEAVRQGLGATAPEVVAAFEEAFSRSRCMSFDYTDREGRRSRRRVEPQGLLIELPAWYLLALDRDKAEVRLFRTDRISRPRLLDQPFRANLAALHRQWQAQRLAAEDAADK